MNRTAAAPGGGYRIMIDALAARFGGTAYATVQLARQLYDRADVQSVAVLTRRGSIVEHGLSGDSAGPKLISLRAAPRLELARRAVWSSARLPALVRQTRCNALISMSGMLPRPCPCPVACVLLNPVMYERGTAGNLVRRSAVRRTAATASFMAAPSRMLAELVSASTGRDCAVVPLGVDHATFAPVGVAGEEILCVADFYAHKRHDLVLEAWLRLPTPRPPLRLIGNPAVDRDAHSRLLRRVGELCDRDSVVIEHDIQLGQLVDAYRRARVFVMASEHESFCMPLVESMACGVPPVVRGLRSLRETAAGGATYLDGDDPDEWATAVGRLLDDDAGHARARTAALRRAEKFSWEAFAGGLLDGLASREASDG